MKNTKLEFLRGLAALEVFICHLLTNNSYLKDKAWKSLVTNWATESVIIFFLLSGIVINISYKRKPVSVLSFSINRFVRIYPLFIVGFLLALVVLWGINYESVSVNVLVGNLFLLGSIQSYIVPVINTNPVVWSLTFEIFFYFIFALTIGEKQNTKLYLWFIISLIGMPFYYMGFKGLAGHFIAMFAFSSIWLLGYFVYEYKHLFKKPDFITVLFFCSLLPGISRLNLTDQYYDVVKYFIFSVFTIPLFLYCIKRDSEILEKGYYFKKTHQVLSFLIVSYMIFFRSNSLMISKAVYIMLPLFFLVLGLFRTSFYAQLHSVYIKNAAVFLGRISYALYIIHFPIVLMINYFLPVKMYIVTIILTVVVVFVLSWFLEYYLQSFLSRFVKRYAA